MKTDQGYNMVKQLEAMRTKGYAVGGYVTSPIPNQISTNNEINYKQIGLEVANGIKDLKIFVSVSEFNEVNNRVLAIENRAKI